MRKYKQIHIRILQTGTTIVWPSADAGRIRITARLHLSGQPAEPGLRIELSFKPGPFRRLFKRSDFWYRLRSYAQREAQQTQPLTSEEQEALDRFRPWLGNGDIEQLPPTPLLVNGARTSRTLSGRTSMRMRFGRVPCGASLIATSVAQVTADD